MPLTRKQLKHFFGYLGLLTTLLLFVPYTRRLGLLTAIAVAIAGRLYLLPTVDVVEGGDVPSTFGMMAVALISLSLIS